METPDNTMGLHQRRYILVCHSSIEIFIGRGLLKGHMDIGAIWARPLIFLNRNRIELKKNPDLGLCIFKHKGIAWDIIGRGSMGGSACDGGEN
jgi:hypothetical protein